MYFKSFDELTFTDDFIFHKVMTQNEHICKKVIELCIGRKVNRIRYKDGQKSLKPSPEGHGIRLDVYLEDDLQTLYDIEMQTSYHKFIGKRIRYYDSVMTINSLESGKQYEKLPNSYIIFICLYDPFGMGRAVYEFTKRDKTDPALTKQLYPQSRLRDYSQSIQNRPPFRSRLQIRRMGRLISRTLSLQYSFFPDLFQKDLDVRRRRFLIRLKLVGHGMNQVFL